MHSSDIKDVPGYESLLYVLIRAYDQAAQGKGAERHACSRPFTAQPMQSISELLGSETGLLYQAMKKIQESQRLEPNAAIRELLGAINYIAGAIIFKEGKQGELPFARSSALKTEWENEQLAGASPDFLKQAAAITASHFINAQHKKSANVLNTLHPPVESQETHWLCYHGNHDVPGKPVPVGDACPICFATSN